MSSVLAWHVGRFGRAVFIVAALLGGVQDTEAAAVSLTWTAPTTNANGTPLTDLGGYRVYIDTAAPPCPGGSYHTVPSTTPAPTPASTVDSRIAGLAAGATYFVRVTAVDDSGNESACSPAASGTARSDVTVTPTTTVSFGTLAAGTTADRTLTVQNTSTVAVSGTASVAAPFSIVSGASYSLAPGASQAVVVQFRPTAAGTFAGNVNVAVGGDTLSRAVSGVATGTDPAALSSISSGTLRVSFSQPTSGATVGGSGTAVLWVGRAAGASNTFTFSVDGVVTGSQTISADGPVSFAWTSLANGPHTLTGAVRDALGNTGTTSIPITVAGSTTAPPPSDVDPTPASPSPAGDDSLRVSITQPAGGAVVGDTAWVVMWVEGASGSSNMFTLTVDGATIGTRSTSSTGPVTIPWETSVPNGLHVLTAVVRDASGRTGRSSITVTVRN
jgi:hypothetical protein